MRLTLAIALLVSGAQARSQVPNIVPLDDSFTVSRRFDSDKATHPEIRLPSLETQAGQRFLFDRRYKTVGERELHLDVFLAPAGRENGHGIVLVHGGAWRSGNKSHSYPLANRLAQRGYAVFMPEFRLAAEAGYPAGLIDVNDAILWAKREAPGFGIDPKRIALGGDSSGGQMASLLAYTSATPLFRSDAADDTRVAALVDLDGVLDLTSPLALRYENAAGADSSFARWVGGSWEQVPDRWRTASAARYVGPRSPPTLILGSAQPRFTAGREGVQAALTRAGVRNRFVALDGAPHTFWLYEPYLDRVVDLIDTFLRDDGP